VVGLLDGSPLQFFPVCHLRPIFPHPGLVKGTQLSSPSTFLQHPLPFFPPPPLWPSSGPFLPMPYPSAFHLPHKVAFQLNLYPMFLQFATSPPFPAPANSSISPPQLKKVLMPSRMCWSLTPSWVASLSGVRIFPLPLFKYPITYGLLLSHPNAEFFLLRSQIDRVRLSVVFFSPPHRNPSPNSPCQVQAIVPCENQ